ncbi:ABC transporter substrate-binding protein [Senegalia sp. (in: firmicutes)]|uniref:ABC transporter substrate-binding protein n=1 Tax=Senegalia sp. (in: firmicutes) TaxID=1924098 RepID=UPI003F9692F5
MKKKLGILVTLLLVLMLGAVGCGNSDDNSNKESEETQDEIIVEETEVEEIILTDNVGREVTLPYPVETAVVANRYNSELIRASGAIDKVIAVDLNTAQDREYWAQFDPENVIGKGQTELNYEKIIELNPQVLILPSNGTYEEAEEKLDSFGIKVFVISGYDTSDFKNQVENIGKMFGTEDKAEEFYDYFNDKLEYIKENVPNDSKKTLYLETTSALNTTFPGDYFYDMADFAGAKNIFSTDYENLNKGEIDPEEVIKRNPEVIVKLITPGEALKGTGLYEPPTKEEFLNSYDEISGRVGWDDVTAVNNDEVYFMTQFSHGGASKLVGSMYIAKWMYPDLLTELDPDEVFRAWMEDYQGFKNIDGHFYTTNDLK